MTVGDLLTFEEALEQEMNVQPGLESIESLDEVLGGFHSRIMLIKELSQLLPGHPNVSELNVYFCKIGVMLVHLQSLLKRCEFVFSREAPAFFNESFSQETSQALERFWKKLVSVIPASLSFDCGELEISLSPDLDVFCRVKHSFLPNCFSNDSIGPWEQNPAIVGFSRTFRKNTFSESQLSVLFNKHCFFQQLKDEILLGERYEDQPIEPITEHKALVKLLSEGVHSEEKIVVGLIKGIKLQGIGKLTNEVGRACREYSHRLKRQHVTNLYSKALYSYLGAKEMLLFDSWLLNSRATYQLLSKVLDEWDDRVRSELGVAFEQMLQFLYRMFKELKHRFALEEEENSVVAKEKEKLLCFRPVGAKWLFRIGEDEFKLSHLSALALAEMAFLKRGLFSGRVSKIAKPKTRNYLVERFVAQTERKDFFIKDGGVWTLNLKNSQIDLQSFEVFKAELLK